MKNKFIRVTGANEHNLSDVNIAIPRDKLVCITGVSGSGKSSLAFDTIFAEGQRKYMESLSSYARQFLNQMQKPNVESVEGLPPTIAIEQHSAGQNPRSIVATTTEIYDYLRLLFARCGLVRCWHKAKGRKKSCLELVQAQPPSHIIDAILSLRANSKLIIRAPVVEGKKGFHKEVFTDLIKAGFIRAHVNGKDRELDAAEIEDEDNPFDLARYEAHSISAIVIRTRVKEENRARITDAVETALKLGKGTLFCDVEEEDGETSMKLFSENFACHKHPQCSLTEMEPRLFSFNSPYGACKGCSGLGTTQEFDLNAIVDPALSIQKGAFIGFPKVGYFYQKHYQRLIKRFCKKAGIDTYTPFGELAKEEQDALLNGSGSSFAGVLSLLHRRLLETENEKIREKLNGLMSSLSCPSCSGGRLRQEALHIFLRAGSGKEVNIVELTAMTVLDAEEFFLSIELTKEQKVISEPILKEIKARLHFLKSVGLEYLNLNRKTATLSGGEAQRIRLATQVGTGLVGVCYVLDEPTIGLHQRDNTRLIKTLRHLVDIGNTVIVVEHDEEMIRSSDYIVDIGPGPGVHGGSVVAEGTLKKLLANKQSLTAKFLSGKESIPIPKKRRSLSKERALNVYGAEENNLKKVNATFPLGGFICVTGVSGSGKSTLVNEILLRGVYQQLGLKTEKPGKNAKITGLEQIDRIVAVDQSPIGKTPRSNPVTYTNAFDNIRALFALSKEAAARGYLQGRFSFNVKGGRCEVCQGQGTKKIEMHFLPDVFVECESCQGSRYNPQTLEVKYRDKSIADVLKMTVEEASSFFEVHPKVSRVLESLKQVGLDYIELGQPSNTLSGGEAQRVKLAAELSRYSTGRQGSQHTLYILDEPTTGLHFSDIRKVLASLQALVDHGNTVIVIEHNLDVIKCADWIVDLGPEGGAGGGTIIAEGPPELVAKSKKSHTAHYLR